MPTEQFYMNTEDALKMLSKPHKGGVQFNIFVYMRGYSGVDEVLTKDGDIIGYIAVTRKAALSFVKGCLSKDAKERGVKIAIQKTVAPLGKNGKVVTVYSIC